MKKNNALIQAKKWFAIGDNEFGYAKTSFEDFDNYYAQICYLCQQAIEKYLKGFLIAHCIKPKKIHDLLKLLEECIKINPAFKDFKENCGTINSYYISSRYPVHVQVNVDKKKTKEAIEATEAIIKFIQKELGI